MGLEMNNRYQKNAFQNGSKCLAFSSSPLFGLSFLIPAGHRARRILALLLGKHAHGFLEIVLFELGFFVDDHIDTVSSRGEEIMLKGCWPEVSIYNMTGLFVRSADPFSELHGVGDGSRQENISDGMW